MALPGLGDMSTTCEGDNCSLPSSFTDDCSRQDCFWEKPIFGLIELACVTVIYIPLMLFGLLGNILTILVVCLRPHMRSSTYLYLSSMAVSDLLILLLLPLDLYKLWRPRPWPLGDLACKMTMFLSECCTFCTILHITFLSLERYLAVCWPITAKTVMTRRRTRTIIGCLWLGAAVSAAPVLVMVGVEDVGAEELGILWEVEQGGLPVSGEETGGTHMALLDGGLEAIKFGGEKEIKGWGIGVEELKRFKGEYELGGQKGRGQGANGGVKDEKRVADESSEQKGKTEFEGDQQNKKKEDEGGGKEGSTDASRGWQIDRRECRCTDFAISSGLLSAMMILSNLYFLVPLSILGLVYSLIGRTLWLRPKSSRRDQSHRNTVKMLGVIVLAFVLCWMPFHVGRTIFSLSLGTGADKQEAHTDTNPHLNTDALADVSTDNRSLNTHRLSKPFIQSHPDTHFFDSLFQTGQMTARSPTGTDKTLCDICANTIVKIDTEVHLNSRTITKTELQSVKNLHPNIETNTHAELHYSAPVNTQHDRFLKNTNQKLEILTTTNVITHKMQNRTGISVTAQEVLSSGLPSTTSTNTHSAGLTGLYTDSTTNNTHFNSTYSHPDTHMYFLYYLSQYFNLVSSVLFYLSAAVNPLLYNLMSARYRLAVHSLIHKNSQSDASRLRTLTARHSTTTL